MDYSKEIENQIRQNQQQQKPCVPAILLRSKKLKVSSGNQQNQINGVENRNSQEENPATSSGIPSDTWEKAVCSRNLGHAETTTSLLAESNKVPFKALLSLVENGGGSGASTSGGIDVRNFFPGSHTQINTPQQSSATMYQTHYVGSSMMSSNTPSHIPSYGLQASYYPDCHPSSLPMGGSVYGERIPAQHLAPVTPNLGKRLDNQVSESSSTCLSKQTNHENERQQEVMENTEFSVTEPSSHHSPSQVESSSAVPNAPENENHKVGNEVEDIDLNATPSLPKKRRKKHRPKVVIEGKPKRTPNPKTPKVGESKTVKRKYVRKKGVQPSENSSVRPKDNADPTWEPDPKRVLDFDGESEARDTNHTAALDHQKGVQSCNVGESSLCPLEVTSDSEFPASHDSSGTKICSSIQNSTQGQRVVGNKPTCAQFDLNLSSDDCLSFQESRQIREDSRNITASESGRGIKRPYFHVIDDTHPHSMNIHGAQLNSMPMYPKVFKGKDLLLDTISVLFPHQKKRRTEKGQSTTTSGTSSTRKQTRGWGQIHQNSSNSASLLEDVQSSGSNVMNGQHNAVGRQFGNLQSSPLMLKFSPTGSKRQRTKSSHRHRSVASLNAIMESTQFPSTPPKIESSKGGERRTDVYIGESQSNMVLALDNQAARMITKKRTKRVTRKVDTSSYSYTDQAYLYERETALFESQYYQSFTKSRGSPNAIKLDDIPSLDQLVQKFYSISINRESTPAMMQKHKSIVPFVRTPAIMQESSAIVPFGRLQGFNSKALVTFEPPKKRKPRAKVDLDPETDRVWNLLMGKESDHGVEGTDVDKEKWWEEERRVFRGRTDSFIARMHLIQGDRRFTRWKGSVVDSVIGVFLTQNVSDHLSSSAFMSLASRFPLQSTSNQTTCYEDGTEVFVEEPDEPEQCHENLSAEPICDQGSITFQEIEPVEEKEYDSLVSSIPSSSLLNELKGNQFAINQGESDSLAKSIGIQHFIEREYIRTAEDAFSSGCSMSAHNTEQIAAMGRTDACLADSKNSRTVEDIVSSQNSVISSQTSDSSVIQTAELIGSCSGSNSEAEDMIIACQPNSSDATGSFTHLLQMASTKRLQGCFDHTCGSITQAEINAADNRTGLDKLDAPADLHLPVSNSYRSNSDLRMTPDLNLLEAESLEALGQESTGRDSSSKVYSPEMAKNDAASLNYSSPSAQGPPPPVQSSNSGFRQETDPEQHPQCCKEFQAERSEVLQPGMSQLVEPGDPVETLLQLRNCTMQQASSSFPEHHRENSNVEETTYLMASQTLIQNKQVESNLSVHIHSSEKSFSETTVTAAVDTPKAKRKPVKEKKEEFDWDSLRRDACLKGAHRKRTANTMDTLDYEAVRRAEVSEIAKTIRERGMNNMLGERIKAFLNRVVKDHGSIDLEWLRDVPPEKAKDYLLSIRGLGLKSVECVRLLTLHQLAFPVDTNVGRIAVRLGWVPLQPLPEEVQLHLLELYPMLESIQKYLWPRLCKLDQPTLYELHYQMITFGKVFCTKHKPNCNACPMRAECRHFASAFASARLALPAPPEKGIVPSNVPLGPHSQAGVYTKGPQLSLQEPDFTSGIPFGTLSRTNQCDHQNLCVGAAFPTNMCEHSDFPLASTSRTIQCEPIVEVPASPEPEPDEATLSDIEDAFLNGDPDEIPTIHLDMEEFSLNLHKVVQENNMQVHLDAVSTALVVASNNPSIPVTKLKNVGRLRTEHQVYELPDNHILLKGRDRRETDDPSPYMLAIWTPGEIANSTQPGEQNCVLQGTGTLCNRATCWSCNNAREKESQIVRGTLLIPCRTAMKGSFPLNGTYFQVNEVFADDESSRNPIEVPRSFLWNLPKRIVYFGTSVTSIFKGLTADAIQSAFWRGFVCVRGFDHKARAPRPLYARLHLAASRMGKNGAKIPEE
ncbi:protein ROS1-like isoform X1 [Papaver somniferum]|uniref:protein ROS1-like isoform X1 n=1 Tax=Papaver somniferum TaxID=3469 RepID=UPI000E6F676D|nr:protein ROS1-like isoform X1 [Papaver somniferum]